MSWWEPLVSRRFVLWLLTLSTLCPWLGQGPGVVGQIVQCLGTDGCRCTLDDGSVIDVSSLGNADGTPRFDKVQGLDTYYYSFNPCYPFSQENCLDAAVCQISGDQSSYFQAGDANTAAWSYDGISAVVYYDSISPDVFRQSWVTYKCDPSATTPTIVALGEQYIGSYYLEVTSQCACPGGCAAGSAAVDEKLGLSAGSILLIVFFGLLFVYLAAGMVFNRTSRQASGLELIPNIAFWQALPSLVKDGFVFVFSKLPCGGRSGYDEV